MAHSKSKSIGHYILGRSIGEGTFGKVKLGTHILTSEKVAVKILEKQKIADAADVERVAREIHILKLLRHPNIVQLYEIIETPKQLYLITEYASGGELFDYIVANGKVKEKEACRFFQQILAGVSYLHHLGVVHRDLKPENLLIDHENNIKIVDFGLSNTFKPGEMLKTACGSPCYAAPEMIAGKKYSGPKVDLWSCGVILFAMICGYLPFEDPNTSSLYRKILNCEYEIPKNVSAEARDLLTKILDTNPETRLTVDQVLAHPWIRQVSQTAAPGLIIGFNDIPIDHSILSQLEQFGFSPEYAAKCLEANKHNHVTTAYYLLLHKRTVGEAKDPPKQIASTGGSSSTERELAEMLRVKESKRPATSRKPEIRLHTPVGKRPGETTPKPPSRSPVPVRKQIVSKVQAAVRKAKTPTPIRSQPSDSQIRLVRGPFNVSCLSSRPLEEVLSEVSAALQAQRMLFSKPTRYLFLCDKRGLGFELELCCLESLPDFFLLKFRKTSGEAFAYRDLCSALISSMSL
jgi:serine/threonine protein kinase